MLPAAFAGNTEAKRSLGIDEKLISVLKGPFTRFDNERVKWLESGTDISGPVRRVVTANPGLPLVGQGYQNGPFRAENRRKCCSNFCGRSVFVCQNRFWHPGPTHEIQRPLAMRRQHRGVRHLRPIHQPIHRFIVFGRIQLVRQGAAGMAMNRVGDSHQTAIPHRVTQIGRAKVGLAKTRASVVMTNSEKGGRAFASLPSFARRTTTAFPQHPVEKMTAPIVSSPHPIGRQTHADLAEPTRRYGNENMYKSHHRSTRKIRHLGIRGET